MRAGVGRLLRRWADRLDPDNALRRSGYSYTVERRSTHNPNSVKLHTDGTGSAFWISAADQEKRFTDAATDWRSPDEKLADMLAQHGEPREDTWPSTGHTDFSPARTASN